MLRRSTNSIIRRTSNGCFEGRRREVAAVRWLRHVVYDLRVADQASYPILLLAIIYWVMGLLVGAAAGSLASLLLAKDAKIRNIFKHGLAGSIGFLGAMVAVSLIRVQPHVTMYVSNGNVTTTTTFRYQHPLPIAFSAAILLPILRELYLFRTGRAGAVRTDQTSGAP